MTDVFVEREFDPARRAEVLDAARRASDAWLPHGVTWRESFLDCHGRRMLCRFEAVSEAAVRDALLGEGIELHAVWAGRTHVLRPHDGVDEAADMEELLLGQRRAAIPVTFADLRSLEQLCEWCFEMHRVRLVRMLSSLDFTRIVYFYRAPDAESVRLAHRRAHLPLDAVWPYRVVAGCGPASAGRIVAKDGRSG